MWVLVCSGGEQQKSTEVQARSNEDPSNTKKFHDHAPQIRSCVDVPRITIQTPGISFFSYFHYALLAYRFRTTRALSRAYEACSTFASSAVEIVLQILLPLRRLVASVTRS